MFSSHPPSYLYAPHRLYWGALIFYLIAVAYALPALAEQYLGWTFSAPFYGITEHFVDRYTLWLGLFSLSLTLTPLIMLTALAHSLPQVLG
ncbi:hypothetical protein QM007_01990 [Rothia sp. SD9660Na]|uniref:hypothetical protein n=1 Tax=Rothia sp. SD9660Na TaxID=3047030 RepID=UPI0024BA4250|nr:hypothetical protein [Rothia sp. SD9660Na]WHS50771.1 hypothetical protein QM007_01990 [Rothia sp. SD9660Na]